MCFDAFSLYEALMDAITINNRVNETSSRSTMTIGVAVRLITFSIIGVITYFAFVKGITLFSWHPPLMLVGVSDIKMRTDQNCVRK